MNALTCVNDSRRLRVATALPGVPFLEPRVVQLAVSSALAAYLQRMHALGAVQGTVGALELNPTLLPVLAALHHVLAGGEVEVRITRGGQSALVQELQERAARTLTETNELNEDTDLVGEVAV